MNPFDLSLPSKIIFGNGCISRLGEEVKPHAQRVLLVSSGNPNRIQSALDSLKASGVLVSLASVKGEPTLEAVRSAVRLAQSTQAQGVVAVGGGSVLDAGKAVAAMAANPGDLMDYVEVIGAGKPLPNAPLFFAAVPTTAGTGTEATRNAVLTSKEHRLKVSLRHPLLVPKVTLLDPALTVSVPPEVTATTGMDTLCQLIEAFTCKTPNAFTDALCREGMTRAVRSLRRVFKDGSDLEAREDMVLASHFSGIALANAKLGAVHGFAAPLGGMYDAAHGAICAALLPTVMTMNLRAIGEREPNHPALGRYREVAAILTGLPGAEAKDGAAYCDVLRTELGIPRLKALGIQWEEFHTIAEKASKASSMKGNPIELNLGELVTILGAAY